METSHVSTLASVESRLSSLEDIVFGKSNKDVVYPKCIDTLHATSCHLAAATKGRDKINQIMKRLDEVEKYLDAEYGDSNLLSQSAKLEVILNSEDQIREKAHLLERVEILKHVLNSEHIKAVPAMTDELQKLSQLHLQQEPEAAELTEETKRLIAQYNDIINTLSKQFLTWNEILLKKEEEAAQRKK